MINNTLPTNTNNINEENTKEDPKMTERGIIHFLPIVEKIRRGEFAPFLVGLNMSEEDFYNEYALGIKK